MEVQIGGFEAPMAVPVCILSTWITLMFSFGGQNRITMQRISLYYYIGLKGRLRRRRDLGKLFLLWSECI